MVENLQDLRLLRGRPIDGVLPAGIGTVAPPAFEMVARRSLSPDFGGEFDAVKFEGRMKGLL
jgi:dethiobiotin synthetase